MNNVPRGTKQVTLLNYLLAPPNTRYAALEALTPQADVHCGAIITDSRLDDELSVATIEFSNTPVWLQDLRDDMCGFPKTTPLGTLWLGVDRHVIHTDGRTEFMGAVIDGDNLLYAEMLAEFPDTPVNVQDKDGMSALHWACTIQHPIMVQLCLSIPDLNTGLRDSQTRTAFDIAMQLGNEPIAGMFYVNIMTIEGFFNE